LGDSFWYFFFCILGIVVILIQAKSTVINFYKSIDA